VTESGSPCGRPLPVPTDETAPFWAGARAGRLMIQHCRHCDRHQHYPRPFCIMCLSEAVEWVEACGRGTVYTFTINHRAPDPALRALLPYAVAVVDLAEGVRIIANVVDSDLSRLAIGAAVEATFERLTDEITLPQFRLVDEG
jgi:uncharacterized OB-fold protein